jgi:hypothetical protein
MTAAVAVAASSSPPLSLLLVPLFLVVAFSARPAAYQLNHQDENVSCSHIWTYFDLLRVITRIFYL